MDGAIRATNSASVPLPESYGHYKTDKAKFYEPDAYTAEADSKEGYKRYCGEGKTAERPEQ
jgi:hypothetical protein